MGKLVIKNKSGNELSIEFNGNEPSKTLKLDAFNETYESIKDMVGTLEVPNDNETCVVKRYHEGDYAINATYIYDKLADKSKHDGGKYIDPTKQFPDDWTDEIQKDKWYNETNTGQGLWIRVLEKDSIDVKDYGAKGNNTSDDSKALFRAFQQPDVYVSEGTYITNERIYISKPGVYKVKGFNATIKAGSNFEHNKLLMYDLYDQVAQIDISGVNFNGLAIPNSDAGEANDILYISSYGQTHDVHISNCEFYTGDRFEKSGGDSHIFVAGVSGIKVEGCRFTGANDCAIYISGDQNQTHGKYCVIENNIYEYCNVATIFKRRFEKAIITNNFVTDCRYGFTQGEADGTLVAGSKMVISNNIIQATGVAVEVRMQEGATVTGNLIKSIGYKDNEGNEPTEGTGIKINGSSYCTVIGNTIVSVNKADTSNTDPYFNAVFIVKRVYNNTTYGSMFNVVNNNIAKNLGTFVRGFNEEEVHDNVFSFNVLSDVNSPYSGVYHLNTFVNSQREVGLDVKVNDVITNTIKSQILVTKRGVGIGSYPKRRLHIAEGFANPANIPADGATGTTALIESESDTVLNLVSPSTKDSFIIFGDQNNNSKSRIHYDPTNNNINIETTKLLLNGTDIKSAISTGLLNIYGQVFSLSTTSTTSTTYVSLGSFTYTTKNKARLSIIYQLGLALTTHERAQFSLQVNGTEIAGGSYSDSSMDYTQLYSTGTLFGVTDIIEAGTNVTIELYVKCYEGNGVSVNGSKWIEIKEVSY